MSKFIARGAAAALVYTMTTQAALADLTTQEVWSDWKSYLSSTGYAVSGDEEVTGNDLTIRNLIMRQEIPENNSAVSINMDRLVFREKGDGSVSIILPDSFPIAFQFSGGEEEERSADGVLTYSHTGSKMIASGTIEDITYEFNADRIGAELTKLLVDGNQLPPEQARAAVELTGYAGSARVRQDELRTIAQKQQAKSLSYDIAFSDPTSTDKGALKGQLQGLAFGGDSTLPLQMDRSDFNQMLKDGFGGDGVFEYASGSSEFRGVGEGEPFALSSSSQGGRLAVALDSGLVAYDIAQNQTAISLESDNLPFPVGLNMAEFGAKIQVPVAQSDDEQDFAMALTLTDFTMSDMIWAMFDPAAQLPRDPATVVLDLTGKAKVLVDFLDPAETEAMQDSEENPFELNAMTLNKLLVSIVGAQLSGTGDFTFDNSDMETFDGMPRPTGQVELELVGGNGLLDRLIAMGVLGDQEAMGARMMMGMLAMPTGESDTLKSKIEITEKGHVLANGQRIK